MDVYFFPKFERPGIFEDKEIIPTLRSCSCPVEEGTRECLILQNHRCQT